MKLTKEEAVRLFHEQWSDMQKELGDCPSPEDRYIFKAQWCRNRYPNEHIYSYCFLCEYIVESCKECPIVWPHNNCWRTTYRNIPYFASAPISEILALPVREVVLNGEQ